MSESYLDELLDELVPTQPRDGWDDVLHRAHRTHRHHVLLVAALAMFILAPATWATVKAFEGTPAPPSVRRTFDTTMRDWARSNLTQFPLADLGKVHGVLKVQTKDGPYDLWAAPSKAGGTCYLGALERDERAGLRASTMACLQGHQPPISTGIASTYGGFEDGSAKRGVFYGYVKGSATTVTLRLKGGRTRTLPVVEHFFLTAFLVPELFRVRAITARDASGTVVARWHQTG